MSEYIFSMLLSVSILNRFLQFWNKKKLITSPTNELAVTWT